MYCARHPQTPTNLRCGRCETPICPRCMVMTPVGARCPNCAQVRRLPTFDIDNRTLLRAIGAGLLFGVVFGGIWGFVSAVAPFFGFFRLIVLLLSGYLAGEFISNMTNRKRGRTLMVIAGVAVFLAWCFAFGAEAAFATLQNANLTGALISFIAAPVIVILQMLSLTIRLSLFELVALAAAIFLAVSRVR